MDFLRDNLLHLIAISILLVLSAVFAGSETIFFSLSRSERAHMKKSGHAWERLAASLLDNSKALLTTILIGNMVCNILIFVTSAILIGEATTASGSLWLSLLGFIPPLLVTYLSDVLPKVLGRVNNRRLAPLLAIPMLTLMRLLWPVYLIINGLILRPMHNFFALSHRGENLSPDEIREMLTMSRQEGLIDVSEHELLQSVVRLRDLRVREIMTPRPDVLALELHSSPEHIRKTIQAAHLSKLPVYEGQIDNILGILYCRSYLLESLNSPADISKMLQAPHYIPDFFTVDRLLDQFRTTKTQLAVVVDEYGALVGLVALEDVLEQLIGDISNGDEEHTPLVQQLSPNEFLLAGHLPVTDWARSFGKNVDLAQASTIAGLVIGKLGRAPAVDDTVRLGDTLITIVKMQGRRILQVRLHISVEVPAP